MTRHLDLDGLADALVGEAADRELDHLGGCASCRAALAELANAQDGVRAALQALPEPAVPPELAARLTAALRRAHQADVVALPRHRVRARAPLLLAAAAGVVAITVGGGLVLSWARSPARSTSADSSAALSDAEAARGSDATSGAVPYRSVPDRSGPDRSDPSGPDRSTPGPSGRDLSGVPTSATGTDYAAGRAALVAALPGLLRAAAPAGTPAAGALSATVPLARCLSPLPAGTPLAVDYASYAGAASVLVVLSSPTAGLVEAYVLDARCTGAPPLLHTSLPRPP